MRVHSIFAIGLSFLTAFAAIEGPTSHGGAITIDKKEQDHVNVVDTRDIISRTIDEISSLSLLKRSPSPEPAQKTQNKRSKTKSKGKLKKQKGKSKGKSKSKSKKPKHNSKSKSASTKPTKSATSSPTKSSHLTTSKSATSTLSARGRIKCGEKGSSCTAKTCKKPRGLDLRLALNRRAWTVDDGDAVKLSGKKGNVGLSSGTASKRDEWIPFEDDNRSVDIRQLTGCTAVIAISEKGMYAFHIWENRPGDSLLPAKYKAALARIKGKLEKKQEELRGGSLYLILPKNPDQPSKFLYDSERWNDDKTDSKSDERTNPEWKTLVPRSDAIRQAIREGSNLSITKEITYLPPLDEDKETGQVQETHSSWMSAQYDPHAGSNEKAWGVWADGDKIGGHTWA